MRKKLSPKKLLLRWSKAEKKISITRRPKVLLWLDSALLILSSKIAKMLRPKSKCK